MIEKYYSIHDVVRFKVVNNEGCLTRLFNDVYDKYRSFESEPLHDLDFIVFLDKLTPRTQGSYVIDFGFYVSRDYLYLTDSYKYAKWKLEISGLNRNHTIVRIQSNLFGAMLLSGFIIDYIIRIKMNQKGFPIVHGASVTQNNSGLLFLARGGGGKTTTALYFLRNGFSILGDDFTILNEGNVLSFRSPLNLFTYNLSPILKHKFRIKNWIRLTLKYLLYRVTVRYIKLFEKLRIEDTFQDSVACRSKLDSVFLLVTRDRNDIFIEDVDREEVIDYLLVNELDAVHFLRYALSYLSAFPDGTFADHLSIYDGNLRKSLTENVNYYRVEMPPRSGESAAQAILQFMQTKRKLPYRAPRDVGI